MIFKAKHLKDDRGMALFFAIILIMLFFIITSALSLIIIGEMRQATQIEDSSSAYMAAETGFERAKNYAEHTTETSKSNQPLRSGSNPPFYSFQVVKAGSGKTYDDPPRLCDYDTTADPVHNDSNLYYCFFSEGRSGSAVRKLDGYTKIRPIDQSSLVSMDTYDNSPPPDAYIAGPWSFYPSSGLASLLNITPGTPKYDSFTFSGYIRSLNNSTYCSEHFFGLLNGANDGGAANGTRKGIGIRVYSESGENRITLVDTRITGVDTPGSTPTSITPQYNAADSVLQNKDSGGNLIYIPIPTSPAPDAVDRVLFTLTYRRAATNSDNHTVTLQVNDSVSGQCLGVETFIYTGNILSSTPLYAFFLPGSVATGSCILGSYTLDESSHESYDSPPNPTALSLVDNGLTINVEDLVFNTQ